MDGQLNAVHPGEYEDGNPESDATNMGGDVRRNRQHLVRAHQRLPDQQQRQMDAVLRVARRERLQARDPEANLLSRTWWVCTRSSRTSPRRWGTTTRKLFVVDKISCGSHTKRVPPATQRRGRALPRNLPPVSLLPLLLHPPPATVAASNGSLNANETVMAVLTETLARENRSSAPERPKEREWLESLMALNKHKPAVEAANKKAVMDAMTETKLQEIGEATGVFSVAEDGSVTFAVAGMNATCHANTHLRDQREAGTRGSVAPRAPAAFGLCRWVPDTARPYAGAASVRAAAVRGSKVQDHRLH